MLATWITLGRLPLLFVAVAALYLGPLPIRVAGVAVLLAGLLLDTLDGVVARRTGQVSLAGSVLDIAADRTYELVLWVCFAHLGMVPVAIPIVIIARTTLTDAVRSVGVARGAAPFEQARGRVARFLVGSSVMRTAYSAAKITAFCGLALGYAIGGRTAAVLDPWMRAVAWVAVGLCMARGVPVFAEFLPSLNASSARLRTSPPDPGLG